ncbi:hypothetical protein H312_00680 [Anncaliia algerae PRA339]|uniref:Uncharacterized protein n=1 Tax=Anncaliia algerae PRA339 TaxID=1288291 RepID=A0A059F4I9_9MICR|nr:hypothetical protein H312_00680 [Anncaliia algerae PRA339]
MRLHSILIFNLVFLNFFRFYPYKIQILIYLNLMVCMYLITINVDSNYRQNEIFHGNRKYFREL